MSIGTDAIGSSVLAGFNRPKLKFAPPVQIMPLIVDCEPPVGFNASFDSAAQTAYKAAGYTKVYHPSASDDMTWLPAGFTALTITGTDNVVNGTTATTANSDTSLTDAGKTFVTSGIAIGYYCFIAGGDQVTQYTSASTNSGAKTLTDTSKNFVTLGIIPQGTLAGVTGGTDKVYISSTSGTVGTYTVNSITTTTNPNDTLVLSTSPGTSTGDVTYQLILGTMKITSLTETKLTFDRNPGISSGNVTYGCFPGDNGLFQPTANSTTTAYIFWPSYSIPVDPVSSYCKRFLRVNSQTAGLATRDVRMYLPTAHVHDRDFQHDGGKTFVMIGGSIKASTPCTNDNGYCGPTLDNLATSAGRRTGVASGQHPMFETRNVLNTVFIEGVKIDTNSYIGLDAFEPGPTLAGPPDMYPDYFWQNILVKNPTGTSSNTLHADGYQPNGNTGWLYFDRVSIYTGLQGAFLDQQNTTLGIDMSNTETRYNTAGQGNGYSMYFYSSLFTAIQGNHNPHTQPVILNNVWAERRLTLDGGGALGFSNTWPSASVFPDDHHGTPPIISGDGLTADMSNYFPLTQGLIRQGTHPLGKVVWDVTGDVGYGYVSPGYLNTPLHPKPTTWPKVTGNKYIGGTLTVSAPVWPGDPASSQAYQWYQNQKVIPSATSNTYVILADGNNASSTSSVSLGTGTKTFTIQSGKNFIAGDYIRITSRATPTNHIAGTVTSYTGTTLVVNSVLGIGESNGSGGPYSDWDVGYQIYCRTTTINPTGTFIFDSLPV